MAIYRFDEIAINSTKKKKPTEEDKAHYIGLEHIDPGCFNIVRWGSDVAPTGDKLLMQKGDVLFGKRRAYQRKVGIAPFDGIFSAHGMVLRPNTEIIDANYFPFFISSDRFMETAVRISVGGLSPTINWKDLAKQEFDLPTLEEQKVLADKLWAAYRLKEAYKKLLAATDEMVKSQFIEMFGYDRYSKFELDAIAKSWSKGQSFKKDNICKDGKQKCIHYGELFTEYGPVIDEVVSSTNSLAIKKSTKGDILFPASDVTPIGLARCSTIMQDDILLGGDIIILSLNGQIPEYVSFAINMQKEQLIKRVTGSVVRHMSAKSLKSLTIPLPPVDKQKMFVDTMRQADKSKFELKQCIENIDKAIKSLINGK